jgi:endonuclease G, mitochondrial
MGLFDNPRIEQITDAIMNSIGYGYDVRSILLSNVSPAFKNLFPVSQTPLLQIIQDLDKLNAVVKLSDGTVPIELWLERAALLVKAFPVANDVIQKALAEVAKRGSSSVPVTNATAPSPIAIEKVTKERIIFRNDMVSYSFLELGYKRGISVGRMVVPRVNNQQPALLPDGTPLTYLGTGWLLTDDLIITNHHVINARDDGEPDASTKDFSIQAGKTIIEFDFNAQNSAGIQTKVAKLEAYDNILDYCILRLEQKVNREPLPILNEEITASDAKPQVVNIIQHPRGLAKKVALRNNHIYESDFPTVRYFTDTEGGSSGSPVFDDAWKVIALHRASVVVDDVNYNGQTTGWVNEGVQIKAILDQVSQKFPALFGEIGI